MKYIKIYIILPLLILSFGACKTQVENPSSQSVAEMEETVKLDIMPQFAFYQLDDSKFSIHDLDPELQTVIYYFDPRCDYCNQQTNWIKTFAKQKSEVQVVMVTPLGGQLSEDYFASNNLSEFDNIVYLWDKNDDFDELFTVKAYPYLFIFDQDNQFVDSYKGLTPNSKLYSSLAGLAVK